MHSSDVSISNSIMWSNTGLLFYAPPESGVTSLEISFTNLEDGIEIIEEMSSLLLTAGENIYQTEPQFCDENQSIYNLQETSECMTLSESGAIIGSYTISCDAILSIDKNIILNKFSLFQNFPNPFNPTTNIKFHIQHGDIYELSIFGLSGNLIHTLFSEFRGTGDHFVQWNSRDMNGLKVPSGAYIYVLKSMNRKESRKMILLK